MGDFSRNFTFLHCDFEHDAARHVTVDDGIDERLVRHARGLRHFQLVRIPYIPFSAICSIWSGSFHFGNYHFFDRYHRRCAIYHRSSTSMSMLPFTCQRFAGAPSRLSWSLLNKMLFQEPCVFKTWKSSSAWFCRESTRSSR